MPKDLIVHWNTRQVYLALGGLMTSAAVLGIDTCPMEGLNPKEYDRILGLGNEYATVCACAVGYRSAEDKYSKTPKVRFPKNEVIEYR
jgi:nitroreductase